MLLNIPSTRRVWLRRVVIVASAAMAVYHVASSGGIVDDYTASNLDLEPKQVALVLWHFSSVVFVSIPIALLWASRAPAEQARPLQAYTGLLLAGLSAVSFPIALREDGLAGLLTMPQGPVALVMAALIAGGMAPRADGATNPATEQFPTGVEPATR